VIFAFVSISILAFACGGGRARDTVEIIPLGAYCDAIADSYCGNSANRCYGNMPGFMEGCVPEFRTACRANRPDNLSSGRTTPELDACLTWIDGAACEQLATAAQQNDFVSLCQVRQ
jgi:hypothetical protein